MEAFALPLMMIAAIVCIIAMNHSHEKRKNVERICETVEYVFSEIFGEEDDEDIKN